MRIYKLPNDYYKEKIKETERGVVFFFMVPVLLILLLLYSFGILNHWIYLVVTVPLLWLCIEGSVILMRRQKVKRWFDYAIEYEKEFIREIVSGIVKREIYRSDVLEAYEEEDELILKTKFGEEITIPNQIEGYDDLRVRLLNWNKVKKTYEQLVSPEEARQRKAQMEFDRRVRNFFRSK